MERTAKKENRTVSELVREAFRRYQEETTRQQQLARLGLAVSTLRKDAARTPASRLTMREMDAEIAAARQQRSREKSPRSA